MTGPVAITPTSYPWLSPSFPAGILPNGSSGTRADLTRNGYVEEEFFLSGTARTYNTDGAETGSEPYRTRVVVRRPADAARADGTVLLEWINVTAQFDLEIDWFVSHEHIMRSGYVWVGLSAQRVGVQALRTFNATRYAGITVGEDAATADAQSFDIYSQAAKAVRYPAAVRVLPAAFKVERLIATGHSQSAARLAQYHNAVQPQHQLVDGFLIHGAGTTLRTDLAVPVLKVLAEYDVPTRAASSEPDRAYLRRWEVAGASHIGIDENQVYYPLLRRDLPTYVPAACARPPYSRIPFDYVQNAAYARLVDWLKAGTLPPVAPRLAWTDATTMARDVRGNALGGIRLPQHEVPVALNDGNNSGAGFCRLIGASIPFDAETLNALYPTTAQYVSAFTQATSQAVAAGFLLPVDAQRGLDAAAL